MLAESRDLAVRRRWRGLADLLLVLIAALIAVLVGRLTVQSPVEQTLTKLIGSPGSETLVPREDLHRFLLSHSFTRVEADSKGYELWRSPPMPFRSFISKGEERYQVEVQTTDQGALASWWQSATYDWRLF